MLTAPRFIIVLILLASINLVSAESQPGFRQISHSLGNSDVPRQPQRIVALTNESTEALLALGITPVGAVKSWSGHPWYAHIADDMQQVTPLGTESQVNLEQLAWLRPDLIIANRQRHAKIAPLLNQIAPTIYSESLRDNWPENFSLYANAVNKQAEGKQRLDQFNARAERIKLALGPLRQQQVSVIRFLPSHVRIYQKASFSGLLLQQLGFARPPLQDVDRFAISHVGKERVADFDGDILIYLVYQSGDNKAEQLAQEWMYSPLWRNLTAVKKQQTYALSDVIWNTAGGIIAAEIALDDVERLFLTNKSATEQ